MSNYCEDVLKPQYKEGWNALRAWFESDEGNWVMNGGYTLIFIYFHYIYI